MGTYVNRRYQYGHWLVISLLRGIFTSRYDQLGEAYAY